MLLWTGFGATIPPATLPYGFGGKTVRSSLLVITLTICFVLSGCAARPIHPGAVNVADSVAYDSLVTTKAVIDQTKADLTANAFPANEVPTIKAALNGLITAYNTLDTALTVYHNAFSAGTVTQAQADAVTNASSAIKGAVTALTSAKGAS